MVFEPERQPCEAAVIWLHGLDDRPEHWASTLAPARKRRPHWKWIFVRAPERRIACYGGMVHPAWGDFVDAGKVLVGSLDHESRDAHGWYAKSVAAVHAHVHELEKAGLPPGRIMMVGVSQGAALAAEAALSLRCELAGWAMVSGWLMPRARTALRRNPNAPGARVLVCHGTADEQVDYGCAVLACKLLREAGREVDFETFEGEQWPGRTGGQWADPPHLYPPHPILSNPASSHTSPPHLALFQ